MKSIRGTIWLISLAVGCVAVPLQLQNHSKNSGGGGKMKQSKTPLYFSENESRNSVITSNNSSLRNDVDENGIGPTATSIDAKITGYNDSKSVDGITTKPSLEISATISNDAIVATLLPSSPAITTSMSTLTSSMTSSSSSSSLSSLSSSSPLSSSSSSSSSATTTLPSKNHNSSTGMTEMSATSLSSPSWSIADTRTELGLSVTSNRDTSTTTRTTTKSTTTTTVTTNPSHSNTSLSAFSTEASSRTIASNQATGGTFLSSSKKSTVSFDQFTTTPASISSKETRESPGKIRPQIKLTTNYTNLSETGVRLPEGASAALAKPTKYHYYPHNQHIYLLPECAVQQVCNAVYVRLNFTQPLCACPGRYRDPCSASLDSDDLHTTELVTDPRTKALTLVKTCEPVAEMRECRIPRDWSLLALQNVRTGKSHYLVICRCPDANILEGPMSHDQPTYASVPGIRVYGMMCVQGNRRGRPLRYTRSLSDRYQRKVDEDSIDSSNNKENTNGRLNFPWYKVQQLLNTVVWD